MKPQQKLMRLAHLITQDQDWKLLTEYFNHYYFNRWRTCEDENDRDELWYEYQGFLRFSKRLEAMNFSLNQEAEKSQEKQQNA